MSRVLLIGRGPLPSDTEPQLGFSQLRTAAFYQALKGAGHQVRLLLLVHDQPPTTSLSGWEGVVSLQEDGPGWVEHARANKSGAEIIVSAGPYNPGRLATAIADNEPVWVDVPGDPLAELQALSMVSPEPLAPSQIAAAHSGTSASTLASWCAFIIITKNRTHPGTNKASRSGSRLAPR